MLKVSALCPFSALILMVGWQERHLAQKNLVPLIPRGSLLDKVEDIRGNWLTQIDPENAVKQNYQYY